MGARTASGRRRWARSRAPSSTAARGAVRRHRAHLPHGVRGVFGPLPDLSRVPDQAAYERQLLPGPSRFDAYVKDVAAGRSSSQLTPDELAGLRLFIGKANCTTCHNGPLLSNGKFHNSAVPERTGLRADDGATPRQKTAPRWAS